MYGICDRVIFTSCHLNDLSVSFGRWLSRSSFHLNVSWILTMEILWLKSIFFVSFFGILLWIKPMSVILRHVRSFLWPIRQITFIWFPVCTYAIFVFCCVVIISSFCLIRVRVFGVKREREKGIICVRYAFYKIARELFCTSLDYNLLSKMFCLQRHQTE